MGGFKKMLGDDFQLDYVINNLFRMSDNRMSGANVAQHNSYINFLNFRRYLYFTLHLQLGINFRSINSRSSYVKKGQRQIHLHPAKRITLYIVAKWFYITATLQLITDSSRIKSNLKICCIYIRMPRVQLQ